MQNGSVTPTPAATTAADLDKRMADIIQDIDKEDDDFTEADEHDPALLAELAELTGGVKASGSDGAIGARRTPVLPTSLLEKVQLLKSRLEMYELAEKAANEAEESTRARRFTRGIQTINEMLKKALGGDDVNVEEIPPEVSMKKVAVDGAEEAVETSQGD